MKCLLNILTIVLALTSSAPLRAQYSEKKLPPGFSTITWHDVYDYCRTMCLPEYRGRYTGDKGYTAAAQWAAAQFKSWGLKPSDVRDGYLQPYPSPYTLIESAEMALLLPSSSGQRQVITLELNKDFFPLIFTDSGDFESELVFAGWGISAPSLGYDDYAGVDVRSKFVLCFRGTPRRADDSLFTNHDEHRTRMKVAKEKGARGLIYIYETVNANPNGDWIKGFCPIQVSYKTADQVLAEKGLKSAELQKSLLDLKNPNSFQLTATIRYRVTSNHFPEGIGYNVIGVLEGSDPALNKECVIVGGHFDHCGEHAGIIFTGAEDNASGSAVVMEIAQAFGTMKKDRPKRSILFVLFGGEEKGLEGSKFLAENLPKPFKKVAGMINFDMVGQGDGAWCGYSAQPSFLKQIIDEADTQVKIIRGGSAIRSIGVRSSDFAWFFRMGAPVVTFGSNGPHLAYHQPGDVIYRINPDIMADIARIGFLITARLASM